MEEPHFKIKKDIPSTSQLEIIEYSPSHASLLADDSSKHQSPIKSENEDLWERLENAGKFKDLLPTGMIKNSSKLRFDVKEISLAEDV